MLPQDQLLKPKYAKIKVFDPDFDPLKEKVTIDYVLVMGGDGTIFQLLKQLKKFNQRKMLPHLITFRMGTLSYLCNIDISHFKKVVKSCIF